MWPDVNVLRVELVWKQVNSQYIVLVDVTQITKCSDDCSSVSMTQAVLTPTALPNASRLREIRSPVKEGAVTAATKRERCISSSDSPQDLGLTEPWVCEYLLTTSSINPLKTKRNLLYLKTQSVPRCKDFPRRL
jgi:hypothetical protein